MTTTGRTKQLILRVDPALCDALNSAAASAGRSMNKEAAWRLASSLAAPQRTLRDEFAGQIVAGLMANPGGPIQAQSVSGWSYANCDQSDVVRVAYQQADAMIEARKK